jgi:uncharacterized membrane protein YqjE
LLTPRGPHGQRAIGALAKPTTIMQRGVSDMASEQYDPRIGRRTAEGDGSPAGEPSLGELFRRLTTDTSDLVRQEVTLAKTELRQAGATVARDGTKIGIAVGLALGGLLTLIAFLVLMLGDVLNNYWLAALIVGLVLLGVGAVLVRSAVSDIKERGLAPKETVGSLRDDAAWAKAEAREVKRELTR